MSSAESVVLVHGIWMTGLDNVLLRRRLRAAGFDASIFTYPSLRRTPAENAVSLRAHLDRVGGEVVHLVGHSLGGLTILHLFEGEGLRRPGRVVFLGAPVRGSAVARVLARRAVTRPLLGRSVVRGVLGDTPSWPATRELGTIAGDCAIGMGHVIGGLEGPSDGTVAVAETVMPEATDRVVLGVSHTGLLTAKSVAGQVVHFLRRGCFDPMPQGATT